MTKVNSPKRKWSLFWDKVSRSRPSPSSLFQFLVAVAFVTLLALAWKPSAGEVPSVSMENRSPLQLKLSDLTSGTHLLTGTIQSLAKTEYFSLTLAYQPSEDKKVSVVTYHDVKVVQGLDKNGASLSRFGPDVESVILALNSDDFATLITQLPDKKALYLLAQGKKPRPIPTEQSPAPTTTPYPVPANEALFEIPLNATFRSDVKRFAAGDKVIMIISSESKDLDGTIIQRQSAPFAATVINLLDDKGGVVAEQPYKTATKLQISVSPGNHNENIVAFANDLSGAVAVYLIK